MTDSPCPASDLGSHRLLDCAHQPIGDAGHDLHRLGVAEHARLQGQELPGRERLSLGGSLQERVDPALGAEGPLEQRANRARRRGFRGRSAGGRRGRRGRGPGPVPTPTCSPRTAVNDRVGWGGRVGRGAAAAAPAAGDFADGRGLCACPVFGRPPAGCGPCRITRYAASPSAPGAGRPPGRAGGRPTTSTGPARRPPPPGLLREVVQLQELALLRRQCGQRLADAAGQPAGIDGGVGAGRLSSATRDAASSDVMCMVAMPDSSSATPPASRRRRVFAPPTASGFWRLRRALAIGLVLQVLVGALLGAVAGVVGARVPAHRANAVIHRAPDRGSTRTC